MTNDRVYIHEFIDIIGQHRADYMHHMTANWSPQAQVSRHQNCYGVWGTVGSTGRWPEVVNIWEEAGFDGLASSFRHEFGHPTLQDPELAEWWARAKTFRRGGVDRILVPAPWTRTIDELNADGVRGEVYAHEVIAVPPGRSWDLLDVVQQSGIPTLERFGWELAGAWATAMCDDSEVILLWAIPTWEQWSAYEQSQSNRAEGDAGVRQWLGQAREMATRWNRILLVDAPLSPFRTGRQPTAADQATYQLPD